MFANIPGGGYARRIPCAGAAAMNLIADENIPYSAEAFRQFGEVRLLPGREISRDDLKGAEALIVRSVTHVGEPLLRGTAIKFIGTATIGTDHLNIPFLQKSGIAWKSAAGCNARSVVEWVLAGLAEYCAAYRVDWRGKTLGIVGHGNIGSRLARVARSLGMRVLANDPPLRRAGELPEHTELDEVLRESDFVSLHVPYTKDGLDATHHLIDARQLDLMKPRAALLNSSRGAVLDNQAALQYANADAIVLLLDVYEGEPAPNRDLVKRCLLSTPHIAGYSLEGKVNGTRMMADALGEFFHKPNTWTPPLAPPPHNQFRLASRGHMPAMREAIKKSYDIQGDSNALREGLAIEDEAAWGRHFDGLRKNYPVRREFYNYHVEPTGERPLDNDLSAMGFAVESN